MKAPVKVFLYLLFINFQLANAQSVSSLIYDAGTGVGIGTTTPASVLEVKLGGTTYSGSYDNIRSSYINGNTGNHILATHAITTGSPPNITTITYTDFIANTDGHVGINVDDPECELHIKSHNWGDANIGLDQPTLQITDPDGEALIKMLNTGTGISGSHGGSLVIYGQTDQLYPPFVILDKVNQVANFGVMPDGAIASGFDFTQPTPIAQVDIRKHTAYDYMLSVGQSPTTHYFLVDDDGNVGIGNATTANARLIIWGSNANNNLDMVADGSNYTNAIRFTSGNTNSMVRHQITEADGNMVIDPGVTSNGNDVLKIDGNVQVTRSGTNGITFDLVENSTDSWDAQLRWIGTNGDPRHIITEADGNLLIDAGYNGNANNKVKVDGEVQVTSNLKVDGVATIGNVTTPCTTGSCYSLYVEKGILAERYKCALSTDNVNWSDYVFAKDYKLMSLEKLEKYVKKNKHLPNVPSADEVYKDGIDLGQMNATLLEKIEELTLYVIQQQKEIDALKSSLKN